jgi:hypothetical protein
MKQKLYKYNYGGYLHTLRLKFFCKVVTHASNTNMSFLITTTDGQSKDVIQVYGIPNIQILFVIACLQPIQNHNLNNTKSSSISFITNTINRGQRYIQHKPKCQTK